MKSGDIMDYDKIVEIWRKKEIKDSSDLSIILDSYSVNFAYNSCKIENDDITYYDTREIFDKDGVTSYTGSLRNLFEIQNAKIAYKKVLEAFDSKRSLNEEFVKEIQKCLTRGTYDDIRYQKDERPGEYKKHDYVTGIHEVGASSEDVKEEMRELLDEMQVIEDKDVLISAAYFHAKFENIHPFSDGNGRVGRMLMNYILLMHNHPPIIIYEEDKKEYYKALEEFDTNIEINKLVSFLKKECEKTWKLWIKNSE